MSNDPPVSIIIPVYNVEDYLGVCLESVTNQTYENIEIILVDDGSTDSSGEKCDEWAKKDGRIKVVHKKNDGLNNARRSGFEKSTGLFITFLDSDDLFHRDNVKVTVDELVKSKAEVAVYGFSPFTGREYSDLDSSAKVTYEKRELSAKREIIEYALLGDAGYKDSHYMTVWGKLYARDVVEQVDWTIGDYRSYEDNFWTPQAMVNAQKVILLSCPLYFYRRNESYGTAGETLGSRLVGNSNGGKPVGYIELVDKLYEFYKKLAKAHDIDMEEALQESRHNTMWWRMNNLVEAESLGEENNLEYLKQVWQSHVDRDTKRNNEYERRISELNRIVAESTNEKERLTEELNGFLSVRRTARRLGGNVVRTSLFYIKRLFKAGA